ncbi:DUF1292 domain-containing protein [Clostridium taeniosporum]|uniref:DUF1292 domain-containing protein n=1 Tax=Clostridium taeniosporum TaxID=394958 RepID=A0A1D7XHP4_9CLOT|nr:DUF1292 domain-containing protein [Clostridium taeniosporum]AOR22660.1 DUF1292 domain-containing protein [Clostridium taeniosporum]
MSKDLNFINDEKNYWGKIYTDIAYSISENSPFISEEKLKNRKYYVKSSVLKDYIKLLDSAELDCKKGGFLKFFKSNSALNDLESFKNKNNQSLRELDNCSKCACLNCTFDCKFKSCASCRFGSYIKSCDKEKINVRKHDNFIVDLTNNDTGASSKYKVLATLENCIDDKQYIILENLSSPSDKLVLYYYPEIRGDSYGEITDVDEFDSIVESYQNSDY